MSRPAKAATCARLTLPDNQDDAGEPRSPPPIRTRSWCWRPAVRRPCRGSTRVSGAIEIWYPGIRGAEALANILFGDVNPSGKLPVTFARSPMPTCRIPQILGFMPAARARDCAGGPGGRGARGLVPAVRHRLHGRPEGRVQVVRRRGQDAALRVRLRPVLHHASPTRGLQATGIESVTFTVRNTGKRAGAEIAQVYAGLPAAAKEPPRRLVGLGRRSSSRRANPRR